MADRCEKVDGGSLKRIAKVHFQASLGRVSTSF